MAGFPYQKTLDDFDFNFQPSINKDKILDLKNLRFLENKENILFVGSPGVGKTHLATSIGIEAASNRYSTYFISCHDLINNLKKANYENRLQEKLKNYEKYSLLIIDEVGYLPIDKEGGNLLVSGLVEWSFDEVKNNVESYGFKLISKHQTNEWVTAVFR